MFSIEAGTNHHSELYLQTAIRADTKIDQLRMDVTTLAISSQTQLLSKSDPRTNDTLQIGNNQQLRVDDGDDCRSIRKKFSSTRKTSVLSFSLILPSWLVQQSLQVNLSRAAQSWTLSLRPYRTISHDAEIWDAISEADFDRMRHLVESGQATVFDQLDHGWTLLHVCFRCLL
jgi:hypothetical protein